MLTERTRCPFCYRNATVQLVGPRRWWRKARKKIRVCEHHIAEGVTAVR